jgi:hypothetical protein
MRWGTDLISNPESRKRALRFDLPNPESQVEKGSSYTAWTFQQIVKERQMEFDTETDPDTLYELFGEDAASLAECVLFVTHRIIHRG